MKTKPPYLILTLCLAALVLFNGIGVFMFTYAKVGIHRTFEMEVFSSENSQQLELSQEEFKSLNWVGQKDFVFQGIVYDCDHISQVNGKVIITCFSDKEETTLKNSLASNFDNGAKNSTTPTSGKNLFKVFPVFPFAENANSSTLENVITICNSTTLVNHFSSIDLELISPPPKVG